MSYFNTKPTLSSDKFGKMCYTQAMTKEVIKKHKLVAVLTAAAIVASGLGACSPIQKLTDIVHEVIQDMPTAEDTLTSLLQVNEALNDAMSRGETELTFNTANIGEKELQNIGDNLSTFWGRPTSFSINKFYESLDDIIPGETVDVRNITNFFELSSNYHVYNNIKNGVPIPEDKTHAKKIAALLPGIAREVFPDPSASDYDKTLAAHNWLVKNIDYDDTTEGVSEENGSYGAIVLRKTMCQGYAEALELLLKCYTDIEVVQIVGEALNYRIEEEPPVTNGEDDESDSDESEIAVEEPESAIPRGWGGHAWNAVKFDGYWYQIDATFNDPKGNPANSISHFYFGQTDEVMSVNHKWERDFFPVSYKENFLFFRKSELFAEDWDSFQEMFSNMLTEEAILSTEIAIQGARIDENNIQFIYQIRREIDEIRWSEQIWNDIYVNSIELTYS
jgi:Uncharacterized protein involved in cytokinesis, contains TGc (transglutaminase/protease-like) domain